MLFFSSEYFDLPRISININAICNCNDVSISYGFRLQLTLPPIDVYQFWAFF